MKPGALRTRAWGVVIALAAASLLDARRLHASSAADYVHASDAITGLDFDDARAVLAAADGEDPRIAFEKARLALYEADCDGAVAALGRPDVAGTEAGAGLADIARGCARVTAATVVERDDAHAVEIRYQDEEDRALTPLIVETVDRARAALTADLGVTWPKPTRIIVVRDLLSLSVMTGLPYESAQTTGTVAVAKWGRVTLLSPRASHHGYAWRDTLGHELTHLAVTRATVDRAPLWLQEGMAKREETRWRPRGPFDDRPSPDAIVTRGMELKLDLSLDKLGPSIAMLPSADQAMVAFAEVTSFVRFFADSAGNAALPALLGALRDGQSVDAALKSASGLDLKGWDAKWRASLAARPREVLPAVFGLGPEPPDTRDMRERIRLAELLLGRAHASVALTELDRIKVEGATSDASLRHLRARALEASGVQAGAAPAAPDGGTAASVEAALGEPRDVVSAYGPWWAIRGRLARLRGDDGAADPFFLEAIGEDPFDVESACQTLEDSGLPVGEPARALCDAARQRREPRLGQD